MARNTKSRGGKTPKGKPQKYAGNDAFYTASSPSTPPYGAVKPVVLREPPSGPSPTLSIDPSPLPTEREEEVEEPVREESVKDESFIEQVHRFQWEEQEDLRQKYLLWITLGILALIILMAALYAYKNYTTFTPTTVTVQSVSWTYSLPLEDYKLRNRSYTTRSLSWEPPDEAIGVDSDSVVVDYDPIYGDVWVKKTCFNPTNNRPYDCSTYERQKVGELPVYGTRWTWQQYEWKSIEPLTAKGNSYEVEYPPFVSTETLRQAGPPVTTFTVTFSYTDDDGEEQTGARDYPRATWERTSIGVRYDSLVDGFDRLRAVSGLDPEYQQLLE